jgi:hypothetical protein
MNYLQISMKRDLCPENGHPEFSLVIFRCLRLLGFYFKVRSGRLPLRPSNVTSNTLANRLHADIQQRITTNNANESGFRCKEQRKSEQYWRFSNLGRSSDWAFPQTNYVNDGLIIWNSVHLSSHYLNSSIHNNCIICSYISSTNRKRCEIIDKHKVGTLCV